MTTQEVLQQCTVEGNLVKLPDVHLERNEYLEVKKALELIGGKWKGGKTQGFVFEMDPSELLQSVASGENRNLKKEYQFFATPPELAKRMMELLPEPIHPFEEKILEPSAGDGALIKAFGDYTGNQQFKIDCFELMDINRLKLEKLPYVNIIGEDFLLCDLNNTYDLIIANPPFTKNQDILHVAKMYECLKPGGTMVTITSKSWKHGSQKMQSDFAVWLGMTNTEELEIEEGAFKESGTMVGGLILLIKKPMEVMHAIPDSIRTKLEEYAKNVGVSKQAKESNEVGEPVNEPTEKVEAKSPIENDVLPEPAQIIMEMEETEKEISKGLQELKQLLTKNNDNMNFFQQLAMQSGGVDMTIRIMTKNNTMTLNIMPGSGSSTTKPLLITGTPSEIDQQFFETVIPGYEEVKGLVTNLDEIKKEAEEKKEVPKKKDEPKKHKKTVKEEAKIEEPQLFI